MKWPFVLRKNHDSAIAEAQRLLEKSLDPGLLGVEVHGSMMEMGLKGGAAQMLAAMFVEQFKDTGAKNYIEVSFHHNDLGRIIVTVQRADGLTPADKLREAEAKLAALIAE